MVRQFNTLDAYRYYKKNKYNEPSEFEFIIESECLLTPKYLFGKSIQILSDKLKVLIENLNDENIIKIKTISNIKNFYELYIKNETYTLLNVLQSCIYNYNFYQTQDNILEFIGYYQPHPLDDVIVLKVKFINSVQESNPIEHLKKFLEVNIKKIIIQLDGFLLEWDNFIK
jgi:DNA-directed RNA polymerase subunit L